jgi:hypothetical protein
MTPAVLGTVGATFVVVALWTIYALPAYLRHRKTVTANPGAIVLSSGSGSAMNSVLDGWLDGPGALPLLFNLVATPKGMTLQKGTDSVLLSVPWRKVKSVTPTLVQERARLTRGIQFVVRSNGAEVTLPFIILGRGPFGSFPESAGAISRACAAMDVWRQAALASGGRGSH